MATTQGRLVELLDMERIEVDIFRGRSPDENLQRVFGGQVAGQALVAAGRTVPPDRPGTRYMPTSSARRSRSPDHLHRRPHPRRPLVHDPPGGSSPARTRDLCALGVVPGGRDGPGVSVLMPEAPGPETVPVWQERLKEYGDQVPARWLRPRPVEVRYVGDPPWQAQTVGGPREPRTMVWLRASEPLPDDPRAARVRRHLCQ